MLIFNKKLSVCPVTTHIDLKQVSPNLKMNTLIKKIIKIDNWYKSTLRKKPKIAVLGMNPHNAELESFQRKKKL